MGYFILFSKRKSTENTAWKLLFNFFLHTKFYRKFCNNFLGSDRFLKIIFRRKLRKLRIEIWNASLRSIEKEFFARKQIHYFV